MADYRTQCLWVAFHFHATIDFLVKSQFLLDSEECMLEVLIVSGAQTETPKCIAPFFDHLFGNLGEAGKNRSRRGIHRHLIYGYLDEHFRANNPLQEIVVQFGSDAHPLTEPLFLAQFNDSSCYGPAEEGGDGKRRNRHQLHYNEDPLLHVSYACHRIRELLAGPLIDALYQN